VSGGNAVQGGAIYNAGDLTLENVVLENNSATDGGAIYNIGNLEMDGVQSKITQRQISAVGYII